jgi:glycosyltransferase involved in cell wall biosynthesis
MPGISSTNIYVTRDFKANGVDLFIANSSFVAKRIQKVYGRSSVVVHPPVDVESFSLLSEKDDFYLAASRLVPYKRMEIIIEAFTSAPNRRLVVIGDGPGLTQCRALASSNVTFLGYQPAAELQRLMRKAKAFLFAAEEDFGITVVEAQACGSPVICYGRGGVLDSVVPDRTGIFFDAQTSGSIRAALDRFESGTVPLWSSERIRARALLFRTSEFRRKFGEIVASKFEAHTLSAAL